MKKGIDFLPPERPESPLLTDNMPFLPRSPTLTKQSEAPSKAELCNLSQNAGKKSTYAFIELQNAKRALDKVVDNQPDSNRTIILAKLREANKALYTFSEGSLISLIEEQNDQLKEEITEYTCFKTENSRVAFDNALQYYLYKILEIARIRQEETREEDQQTIDAKTYICHYFDTPCGLRQAAISEADHNMRSEILSWIITKLGDKHNHIIRSDKGFFSTTRHIVKFQNGIYSSESAFDLAMTVKAHGHNDFEFSIGSTQYGALVFRQTVAAMIRVGIKDITFTVEVRANIYRMVNEEAFAILERICAASRFAYYHSGGNSVFDENGDFKQNGQCAPAIQHQANTFLELATDTDRAAYLEILFPVDKDIEYKKFVDELELRRPRVSLDGLSPRDYFATKFLWIWNRTYFLNEYEQHYKLGEFNKNTTSIDARITIYLETNDVALLQKLARSERLTFDDRIILVIAVFENVQQGKLGQLSLSVSSLFGTRLLSSDDIKKFLNKSVPLFKNLYVKKADATDYVATAQECSNLLFELRVKSLNIFRRELLDSKSNSFENFYKNKLLLDGLETELRAYMANEFTDKSVIQAKFTDDVECKSRFKAPRVAFIKQYTQVYSREIQGNMYSAAEIFVTHFHPEMQRHEWLSLVKTKNIHMQSLVVMKFFEIQIAVNNDTSTEYLKKYLSPLIKQLNSQESKTLAEKLRENLFEKNRHGCNKKENAVLDMILGMFNELSAGELLRPAELFKTYYFKQITITEKAQALLVRIRFLISEKPNDMFHTWMFNRSFDSEIMGLLFTNNIENPDAQAILDALKNEHLVNIGSEEPLYIQRIAQMLKPAIENTNPKTNYSAKLFGDVEANNTQNFTTTHEIVNEDDEFVLINSTN